MFAHGESVTVLSAGLDEDPYSGEFTPSWEWAPTETVVSGVAVALGGSLEPLEAGRSAVDSDFDLFFPPDAVVTSDNRVVVRGLECDVAGRPFLWRSPFTGWTPGLVVQVKIREG